MSGRWRTVAGLALATTALACGGGGGGGTNTGNNPPPTGGGSTDLGDLLKNVPSAPPGQGTGTPPAVSEAPPCSSDRDCGPGFACRQNHCASTTPPSSSNQQSLHVNGATNSWIICQSGRVVVLPPQVGAGAVAEGIHWYPVAYENYSGVQLQPVPFTTLYGQAWDGSQGFLSFVGLPYANNTGGWSVPMDAAGNLGAVVAATIDVRSGPMYIVNHLYSMAEGRWYVTYGINRDTGGYDCSTF